MSCSHLWVVLLSSHASIPCLIWLGFSKNLFTVESGSIYHSFTWFPYTIIIHLDYHRTIPFLISMYYLGCFVRYCLQGGVEFHSNSHSNSTNRIDFTLTFCFTIKLIMTGWVSLAKECKFGLQHKRKVKWWLVEGVLSLGLRVSGSVTSLSKNYVSHSLHPCWFRIMIRGGLTTE